MHKLSRPKDNIIMYKPRCRITGIHSQGSQEEQEVKCQDPMFTKF